MKETNSIPNVLDMVKRNEIPTEIRSPDATLLMKPYSPLENNPLIINRKVWRLLPNYMPVSSDIQNNLHVAKVNSTRETIEIKDSEAVNMMAYVRLVRPGATVEEVISSELERTESETGKFKDDDELGAYAMYLYITLALVISKGLLSLEC
jgi:hypothetical protein